MIPDTLKGLLVDDWENITKNRQVKFSRQILYLIFKLIQNL
jgi:hypothetical protein